MKTKKTLKTIIISLFVIVLLLGIYGAMSVQGPGLPTGNQKTYMVKSNGQKVSCFLPFLGSCTTAKPSE